MSYVDCTVSGSTHSCAQVFPDLDSGTHRFTVTPTNLGGSGPASSTSLGVTDNVSPPGAVTSLAGSQPAVGVNSATITGSPPSTGAVSS